MTGTRPKHFVPALDSLERRDVPSTVTPLATMKPTLVGRTLTVIGDDNANTIVVSQKNGYVSVLGKSFLATAIDRVVIDGKSGNDYISAASVYKIAYLYGNYGNDTLLGSAYGDLIYGGGGDDKLYGLNGNDWLEGGAGKDYLNGGLGTNTLIKGTGADTVLNGVVKYNARVETATALEAEIIRLTNVERAKYGLAALTTNTRLNYAAQWHANQMVAYRVPMGQNVSHEFFGPITPTTTSRLDRAGYEWTSTAENNSWGSVQRSAADIVAGWMASSGHRANILATDVKEIGVGLAGNATVGWYACQVFGKR
jgi:uncharacterized protein YkwD